MDVDTASSFRSCDFKVDEQEEQAYRRKSRKRFIIISVSTVILVVALVGAIVGTLVPSAAKNKSKDVRAVVQNSTLSTVCGLTRYPESCNSSISSMKLQSKDSTDEKDPEQVFKLSLQVSINELMRVASFISAKSADYEPTNEWMVKKSLRNCQDLIGDAIDKVNRSQTSMDQKNSGGKILNESKINDMRTWLSTALTDHVTCVDGVAEAAPVNAALPEEMRREMRNSTEYTSNSLAIASNMLTILEQFQMSVHRKLLWIDNSPAWLGSGERRLLAEEKLKPNATVAKDGTGDFLTIGAALMSAPKMKEERFVIYVKEGVYVENVVVDLGCWNVMIYGDGMNRSIVSGSLNIVDGTPTFTSGTLIAAGKGFIAKDMGFINTAGPSKNQAVAVRSSSDKSIFYRCSFDAYQDTLYVHTNRQLFRECLITGTIDFIFGFATVVFQNCDIQPRQPLPGQFNAITAHGKFDPNQNTGISILRCRIAPSGRVSAPTFLGRPWKDYSTTVVMESYIDWFVDPSGWTTFTPKVDPPSTIFYAEYMNNGPGSGLSGRVKWAGYRPNMTAQEAAEFSVDSFIQGNQWLPGGGIVFDGTSV